MEVHIGERMKRRRESLGLTQVDIGNACGVSFQTVSGWERQSGPPPAKYIPKLCEVLKMRPEELLGMDPATLPPGAYPVTEMVLLPVIGQAQAGRPRIVLDDELEMAPIEKELVAGGDYFWMRVEGDSMINAGIHPGDLVLVRRQPFVENGQIAVVDIFDDGVVIKQVYRAGNRLVLISANPAYMPMSVSPENCRIIGLVREIRRRIA